MKTVKNHEFNEKNIDIMKNNEDHTNYENSCQNLEDTETQKKGHFLEAGKHHHVW